MNEHEQAVMAAQILSNPIYQEAMLYLKAEIYTKFNNSTLDDDALRKELWSRHNVVADLESYFETLVETAKLIKNEEEGDE